jgi:hypothetical protein
LIIVFAGSIGRFPVGGHAWVDLQYLLGLRELGHQVYYLEECGEGSWVYHWELEETTTDLSYPTNYLRDRLDPVGLEGCWIYRAGDRSVGMPEDEFVARCSEADLLIARGCPLDLWRPEYDRPRRRIFIDSDPGFTQIRLHNRDPALCHTVERCHHLFTVGQRVGSAHCRVPTCGHRWQQMLPPVALSAWPPAATDAASHFTSVMQWRSYREVVYEGQSYGSKDREFARFLDLPRHTPQPLRIALTGGVPQLLAAHGWDVCVGWSTSFTPEAYREFIVDSRAELSVAKQGYVAMRSGWFSDRSACYLASGRPVLLQDTGLEGGLPVGEGILTFRNLVEAVRGIEAINADYDRHRRAARRIAERYIAASRVLEPLLERAMS